MYRINFMTMKSFHLSFIAWSSLGPGELGLEEGGGVGVNLSGKQAEK